MTVAPMLGARVRLFLARRPWVYWCAAAALAVAVGLATLQQLEAVDEARRRWADRRAVVVAAHDHRAGDELVWRTVEFPLVAIPPSAIDEVAPGTIARQRIGTGEVVVTADVTAPAGPAAGAEPGTVVVPVADPLVRDLRVGLPVQIVADGVVLADEATIVAVHDDVAYVAASADDAPIVAAAARTGTASILFLP